MKKIDLLENQLREKEEKLLSEATHLSEKRKQTAKDISKAVEKILKELAFEKAGFRVDVMPSPLSSTGIDIIEFLFQQTPESLLNLWQGLLLAENSQG